jgi:hypothetical protein
MRPAVTQVAEDIYASMPAWSIEDGDINGWALLLLCDAQVRSLQPIIDVSSDTDTRPGWANAMDPDTVPGPYLPWLGQFAGVRVNTFATIAAQRNQIKTGQGYARGTPGYLLAAIKAHLQDTQTVHLYERDTSAYHLSVEVYRGELAGPHYSTLDAMYPTYNAMDAAYPTYNDMTVSTQPLLDAAEAAKPGGLILAVTILPGTP